jgi:hypothetical protein
MEVAAQRKDTSALKNEPVPHRMPVELRDRPVHFVSCSFGPRVSGQKPQLHPTEQVIHDGLCVPDLRVARPAGGLEACMRELVAGHFQRYAVLKANRNAVLKHSINRAMVDPAFAIRMKISLGWPLG